MMAEIKEQMDRDGHAEVLVILKPEKHVREDGRLALDLASTRELQAEAVRKLSTHFSRFEKSREVIITRELRQQAKVLTQSPLFADPPAPPRAKSVRYFPNLGVMLGTVDEIGLKALEANNRIVANVSAVSDAELIKPHLSMALAADIPQGNSWGIERLAVPALWDAGARGDGVTIGHVDTGVDASHPALAQAVDGFAEFDRIGEQIINAPARDTGRHGTHTAGILVGAPHQGLTFGVAPGSKLASATVIEGGKVAARLLGGLDWCVGQNVRIVNISLGFRGFDSQFVDIIRILRQREILPVVAIGNEGPQTSRSPGNYREAFSIGAIDQFDQVWIDSSSMKFPAPNGYVKPDIIAPGSEIWSSVPGGGLQSLSGTSMAAPHIAGLAALLWSVRPDAKIVDIENAILKSATRPPGITTARGNRGVPNGLTALKLLD